MIRFERIREGVYAIEADNAHDSQVLEKVLKDLVDSNDAVEDITERVTHLEADE